MNPLDRVTIGDTGVEVTRLGLGGGTLSPMALPEGLYDGASHDEAVAITRRAYELGIRYFDVAPLYGFGRSEVRIGKGLSGFDRSSFVLSTKAGRLLVPKAGTSPSTNNLDALPDLTTFETWTRDNVLRSIDESLQRLKTDRVDIVYVHDPDEQTFGEQQANDEAFPALFELREQGTIGVIGCGMNQWQMPARFIRRFDLDIVLIAGRYTLLDHSALPELLPLCIERNVKVTIGGPYNTGILARDLSGPVTFDYEPAPQNLIDRAKKLDAICRRHGVDLKAAALAFVLAHPAVATVIPGARTVAEVEQNVDMAGKAIPQDLWTEMRSEALIPEDAPTPAEPEAGG